MKTHLIRAALLGAVAFPATAYAQDAQVEEAQPAPVAPETEATGNEIVVTATKREQTLQDVPVAVSVTTSETIERAQVRDLKDLQTLVPALRVSQLQSSANTNFIIRGFGNGANNPGIEPSVGVFVDGVYRSRTAAQIGDLPDVQRVEVLRGPQSTLFGKNASAGVISMVTREPSFDFKGSLEATYGNYDALVLKGYVTGPISDKVAASIAAGINKRDGYITDLGYNGTTNERDRWFVRGQLRIEPTDVLKVRLIADYDKLDEACCGVVNIRRSAATSAIEALGGRVNSAATPFADVTYSNFPSTNDVKNWGLSGQIDYEMGPLTLTSITAYRNSANLTNQDSDFTSGNLIGQNRGDVNINTLTQELRLNANFLNVADLMVGGFFFDESVKYTNALTYGTQFRPYANLLAGGAIGQLESAVLGLPTGTLHQAGHGIFDNVKMDNRAWSIFGNLDLKLGNDLTLTLGGNYTKDRKDVVTATVSTDTFSGLDFVTIGNGVIRNTVIAQQVGGLLGVGSASASQIASFAAAQPGPYGQIVTAATAFAGANATNPAVNPLLALRPLQFLPPFLNIPNAVENGKTRDGKFTWTARLAWEVTDTVNTYLSYATGFKASSFNLSRDSRPLAADLPALRAAGLALPNLGTGSRYAGPENAKVLELGVKANWGIASANLTMFKQTITGFQSNVFTGTGFALANAGKQSTFGVEFDGMVKPTDALSLNLALIYLEPKYDSFVASAVGDLSGTRPAGIPGLSTTIGAQWNKELANGDRVILRGDWHWESEVQVTEGLSAFIQRNALGQVTSYQPAFDAARPFTREVSEINASLTYAMSNGTELSLWGRNLTNNRYLVQIFDSVAQSGSVSGYPNQPRTYGASIRYKW